MDQKEPPDAQSPSGKSTKQTRLPTHQLSSSTHLILSLVHQPLRSEPNKGKKCQIVPKVELNHNSYMQQFNCSIWSFTNLQWSFPLSPLPSYSAFIQSYQCNGYLEWQLIARLHKICQQWGRNSIWVCSVATQLVNKIPTLQTCLNTLPWDNLELFPQQFFWHQCHHFLGSPFPHLLQILPPP